MKSRALLVAAVVFAGCSARQGLDQAFDADVAAPEDARGSDAGSFDAPAAESNGCALGRTFLPPPDPACGDLPAEFEDACGCGDSINLPRCRDGRWVCLGQQPRRTCASCSGFIP